MPTTDAVVELILVSNARRHGVMLTLCGHGGILLASGIATKAAALKRLHALRRRLRSTPPADFLRVLRELARAAGIGPDAVPSR